jgi:hypothetical protein
MLLGDPAGMSRVGWMTLFSSTTANGGWMKRHPPYGSEL